MIGNVIKIHSDFYYVKIDDNLIECKVREILKKEHIDVLVGDMVSLDEYNEKSNQAVITAVSERKSHINRPAIANIDQVVVITTLKKPHINLLQLDRYLSHAKLFDIPAVICVNKHDLLKKDKENKELLSIYENLGYKVVFTSALDGTGIEQLKDILKSKISVFCGASGVGKSSLLNMILPELALKTKNISTKTGRGIHTTRHTELIEIKLNDGIAKVADTPGFSYLKFDTVTPDKIEKLFEDIGNFADNCYFNDCLHIEELDCNVINNLDKIASSRYESYKAFVSESIQYKEFLANTGHKIEKSSKSLDTSEDNKIKIVKLGSKAREKSRKNKKQKLNTILSLKNAYYNNDDIEY